MSESPAPRVHLPVLDDAPSSLSRDGRRIKVVPADVSGVYTRARAALRGVFLAFGLLLLLVRIDGRPLVFLDVEHRRFFVFGGSFNAQDAWLVFFLLSGLGFALVVSTSLLGRAWCGWTCPQTVLLEGLFRPIERWVEGPRNARLRRDAGPWTFDRTWRKVLKHTLYWLAAWFSSHVLLAFFVSLPSLGTMIVEGPVAHWQAFTWTFIGAALLYANFAWFREQLCLIVCPYGRLQSILTDDDSLVVGYDTARGEPRGHKKKNDSTPLGDCVDCNRCVAVCPTGIDIRHGLQVDCIACTQCIDACDDVMTKLGRPRGLVRYDSLRGLRGEPRRFFRPRLILYAILGAAGLAAVSIALLGHHQFEANLLRAQGAPFVREGEILRNTFDIHLVNKRDSAQTLHIETAEAPPGAEVRVAQTAVELEALGGARVPVVVLIPLAEYSTGMQLVMRVSDGEDEIRLEAPLLGPIRIP